MAQADPFKGWQARQRYQEILEAVDNLDKAGVRRSLALLSELREWVERELGRSDWETYRARQLLDAIRFATDDFKERYWGEAQGWQRRSFELGLQPFEEMGLGLAWAGIWRQGFEAFSQNGLWFIEDLAGDLRQALAREVLLTTSGGQAPVQAMQNIKDLLGDGRAAANRAQAIVRTEVGRNYAMATQLAQEQAREWLPDLLKMWLHSPLGTSKTVRLAHLATHGRAIGVNEYFWFPGGQLRFPHDPLGPASECVHCKCRIISYREEWGPRADWAPALGEMPAQKKRGKR